MMKMRTQIHIYSLPRLPCCILGVARRAEFFPILCSPWQQFTEVSYIVILRSNLVASYLLRIPTCRSQRRRPILAICDDHIWCSPCVVSSSFMNISSSHHYTLSLLRTNGRASARGLGAWRRGTDQAAARPGKSQRKQADKLRAPGARRRRSVSPDAASRHPKFRIPPLGQSFHIVFGSNF